MKEAGTRGQRGAHPPEIPEEVDVVAGSWPRQVGADMKGEWPAPHDREEPKGEYRASVSHNGSCV